MKLVTITIPIYKQKPTCNEKKSFIQCLKIFYRRPIKIVCPNSLNTKLYEEFLSECKISEWSIERFSDTYFININGYNKLLLSSTFYTRFIQYRFIQIYQLDAWVFRDELDYWCNQNYDFIGAPWFENYQQGNLNFISGGNGGFSLRKVKSAIKILKSHKRIVPFNTIWKNELEIPYNFNGRLRSLINLFITACYLKNNTYFRFNDFKHNEDVFWSAIAASLFKWYQIPKPEIAAKFSFELNSSFLFNENNYQLPMGCHAWEKHEPEFWSEHLNTNI